MRNGDGCERTAASVAAAYRSRQSPWKCALRSATNARRFSSVSADGGALGTARKDKAGETGDQVHVEVPSVGHDRNDPA